TCGPRLFYGPLPLLARGCQVRHAAKGADAAGCIACAPSRRGGRGGVLMVVVTPVMMLRQEILTRLRQFRFVLMQALADTPWARRAAAEGLRVSPAGLLPGRHLFLHLRQVRLAVSRQLTGVLLQTGRKSAPRTRGHVRAQCR